MTEKQLLEKMAQDIDLLKIDVQMLIHNDSVRNNTIYIDEIEEDCYM